MRLHAGATAAFRTVPAARHGGEDAAAVGTAAADTSAVEITI
jgi:hypothetical protein